MVNCHCQLDRIDVNSLGDWSTTLCFYEGISEMVNKGERIHFENEWQLPRDWAPQENLKVKRRDGGEGQISSLFDFGFGRCEQAAFPSCSSCKLIGLLSFPDMVHCTLPNHELK